jgi:hypothetical protein
MGNKWGNKKLKTTYLFNKQAVKFLISGEYRIRTDHLFTASEAL